MPNYTLNSKHGIINNTPNAVVVKVPANENLAVVSFKVPEPLMQGRRPHHQPSKQDNQAIKSLRRHSRFGGGNKPSYRQRQGQSKR